MSKVLGHSADPHCSRVQSRILQLSVFINLNFAFQWTSPDESSKNCEENLGLQRYRIQWSLSKKFLNFWESSHPTRSRLCQAAGHQDCMRSQAIALSAECHPFQKKRPCNFLWYWRIPFKSIQNPWPRKTDKWQERVEQWMDRISVN